MDTSNNKQSPPAYQQKTYKRQQIKCANASNLSLSLLSTPTSKAHQHQQQSLPTPTNKAYQHQKAKHTNTNKQSLQTPTKPTNTKSKAYQHQQQSLPTPTPTAKPTNTNSKAYQHQQTKPTNNTNSKAYQHQQSLPTSKAYQHQKQSLPIPTAKPTNTNKESFQHQQTKPTNTDKQSLQTPTKAVEHLQPKLAPIISDIELQFSLDLGQTWSLLLPACLPSNLHCSSYYADSHYTSDLHAGWNRITVLLPERAR